MPWRYLAVSAPRPRAAPARTPMPAANAAVTTPRSVSRTSRDHSVDAAPRGARRVASRVEERAETVGCLELVSVPAPCQSSQAEPRDPQPTTPDLSLLHGAGA